MVNDNSDGDGNGSEKNFVLKFASTTKLGGGGGYEHQ